MSSNDSFQNCSNKEIANQISMGKLVLREANNKIRVWTVFAKIDDLNGVEVSGYVCCRMCRRVFTFSKPSCSSNLVKHRCYTLKFMNKPELNKPESPVETVVPSDVPKLETFNIFYNTEDAEIDSDCILMSLLTKCVIKNSSFYDLIHDSDFKSVLNEFVSYGVKFGNNINVDQLLPSPDAVAQNINQIYGQCLARVKFEIDLIKENGFSLAVDICENNFLRKTCIALTLHYLKDGILRSRLLGVRSAEGEKCTSQNIYENVKQILQEFNCEFSSKILMVTNANVDILETQTLPCISRLLNNALQQSIDEVSEVAELINNCIKLAKFLKREENGIWDNLLQSHCPNRWVTIRKMLLSIENNWNQIERYLEDINEELRIRLININHLKAVTRILQPFKEAIETLEDNNHPTLHLVLVYLHDLKKCCDSNKNDFEDIPFISFLKDNLRVHLEKIVQENLTVLHKLALFLYPPTNKLLQFTSDEKQSIEFECLRLMKCFRNELSPLPKPLIKSEPNDPATPPPKRQKLFSDFVEPEAKYDPNDRFMRELQIYKLTFVENSEDFDVFSWWERQSYNFPLLYKLTCIVLATPASSNASKRLFPAAANLLCEEFNDESNEQRVEKILFINLNPEQTTLECDFLN